MKHIKSYEQFSIELNYDVIDETIDYTKELELLEGLFGSNKTDDQIKEEIKKSLEKSNATTLKTFIDKAIDNKKIEPDRILKVLKQVFLSNQGWLKNKHKYEVFKNVATEAIQKNDDGSWKKAIGLLDFAMKGSGVSAPYWDEQKKAWINKAKPGSVGL